MHGTNDHEYPRPLHCREGNVQHQVANVPANHDINCDYIHDITAATQ